jgi:hypothetical protein
LLILVDWNNYFEIHDDDDIMMNLLIVVESDYVDNVDYDVDDLFDDYYYYYSDDNIDKNSMMNSMVMTGKKNKNSNIDL